MSVLRDGRRVFLMALAIGLVVRLAVFTQTSDLGLPILDERHYTQLATNVLAGNGFAWAPGEPTSMRPPLYPGFVASIWWMTGAGNLQAVRFVQILLALASTFLVFRLGRRLFDDTTGYWAAAIFWLYPTLVFFNFTILTETLFTFLLLGFVLLGVRLVQAPSIWTAVACGLVLGLAALARSVLWPLPLLLCPLLLLLIRRPFVMRVALAGLVFAGYAAVIAPWAVRNTRLQGVTTMVDTMGGVNLRLGNYEHTPDDRMWAAIDTVTGDKEWSYALRQQHPGRHFTEGEKDKWAQAEAVKYMRANPGTTLRRAWIKFADFWGIEREFLAYVQYGAASPPAWFTAAVGGAVILGYVLVVLGGAAGFWLASTDRRALVIVLLPVVLITGVHTIAFGHSRYHLPLMPIFGVFAAALVARYRSRLIAPRGAAWFGAMVSIALLVAIWLRQFVFSDADRIRRLLGLDG